MLLPEIRKRMIEMKEAVTFQEKDWKYPDLEIVASEVACFVHNHKSFLGDLNTFMRNSSTWWKNGVENSEFQKWLSKYIPVPKKAPTDKQQFASLLTAVKDVCKIPEEWNKMRGLIPEKIYEIHFAKKHIGATIGFGVQVSIFNEPVIYNPVTDHEDDGKRKTVDAGSWNGTYGEFAEVKFQPDGFQIKEFGYLHLLEEKLNVHKIDHRIYLVTFDQATTFVKGMLENKGLLPKGSRFHILGPQDIVACN